MNNEPTSHEINLERQQKRLKRILGVVSCGLIVGLGVAYSDVYSDDRGNGHPNDDSVCSLWSFPVDQGRDDLVWDKATELVTTLHGGSDQEDLVYQLADYIDQRLEETKDGNWTSATYRGDDEVIGICLNPEQTFEIVSAYDYGKPDGRLEQAESLLDGDGQLVNPLGLERTEHTTKFVDQTEFMDRLAEQATSQ